MAFSEHDIYEIFLDNRPQIQGFLLQRLRCRESAADLLQDIYLRLGQLNPPPCSEIDVKAWLFTVASNLSIDHLRRQKRRSELLEQYWDEDGDLDPYQLPEQNIAVQQQLQHIESALAQLPDQCAEILYLSRIEGLPHKEIAERLRISTSWVEKQLAKALSHCRQAME